MTHANTQLPRRFLLVRDTDETGVSGTGTVAEGIQFRSGRCVMEWIVPPAQSIGVYTSVDDLLTIHGHNGKTRVDYLDA